MTAGDQVSDETRMTAARVRERAARMPTPDDVAGLAARALDEPRSAMPAEEIRRLAREAVAVAEKVSRLLAELAGLLGESAGAS